MSQNGVVLLTTELPSPPPGASFALTVEFEKGAPNPGRVFQAADQMIRTFERLDRTLCASVDARIEPIMILEDIEVGSIKTWLGQQLNRVDDDALKTLEWKRLVGNYLVKAKYAVIRWSNKDSPGIDLIGLSNELKQIASETDVKYLPDYAPPPPQALALVLKQIDVAKDALGPKDGMLLEAEDQEPVRFNLAIRWDSVELESMSTKETTKFEKMPMTLIVKKPDYLGNSKWDFRHGTKTIQAKLEDAEWLIKFQSREIDVRPGDALRCLVSIEHRYGFDNELVGEEYTITLVEGVAINQVKQGSLEV